MSNNTRFTFLYSIYDKKTNEHGPVLEFGSGPAAVRAIQNLIKTRPDSPIALNPEDFELHYLGSFSTVTGNIHPALETLDFFDAANNSKKSEEVE